MSSWHVEEEPTWPFDILIKTEAGEVMATFPRHAYSTECETLDDLRELTGWFSDGKEEALATNIRQLASIRMMAAAPELTVALIDCLAVLAGENMTKSALVDALERGMAALRKAILP